MSIDCKMNEVSSLNQEKNILDCNTRQSVDLFLKKLCAKMMIPLCLQLQNLSMRRFENSTMMYRAAMRNGIDCCNNQTLLILCCNDPF